MTALIRRVDALEDRTPDGEQVVTAIVDAGDDLPPGNVLVITERIVGTRHDESTDTN